MQKITPFLWFNGQAEDAAKLYVSLFPNSRIERVNRSPVDTPSGPAGMVLTVEFTLGGVRFIGLHGVVNLPDAVVDDRDGAGVEVGIAPVDVIGVLVVNHHRPRPQSFDGTQGKGSQQAVASRVLQAARAVVFRPALPE